MWRVAARVIGWPLRPRLERAERTEARAAIVVLGAVLGRGDQLSPVLAERVEAAARLFAAGAAPRVVVTGGVTGRGRRSEAEVMAAALEARGVPRGAILVEDRASTTAENARFTAALLAPGARV